jgi:hypothetical protein
MVASEQQGSHFPWLVKAASIVTLLIKLAGVWLAVHEAVIVDPPRDSVVFAIAAFMMAGATGIDNVIDRFLGGGGKG